MDAFVYTSFPGRVVFGDGSFAQLRDELARLDCVRALVLCTPGQRALAQVAADRLGELSVGIFDGAVMHVPSDAAQAARQQAAALRADCCVAIGGGSTIGLGKAIALSAALPIIAVPTTFAGSEMTAIWGVTEAGVKRTGRDTRVLPKTVIYDPTLLAALPARIAGASGINAIAHCVEALYAVDASPIVSMIAEEGIRALAQSLPRLMSGVERIADDATARSDALYGAWLSGTALNGASMAIHHKLCHTLGGTFNLPHAETHTVVLPYAVAYVEKHVPHAMARVRRALGAFGEPSPSAAAGLARLARAMDMPASLRELGMPEAGIDRAADLAVQSPYANPRPVERAAVRALIEDAWHGRAPGTY